MTANKTVGATFVPDTADSDGDGLSNYDEVVTYGTNPLVQDTDGDGLTDGWEAGLGRFSVIGGSFTWAQARADAHTRHGELACFATQARWNRGMESIGANALDPFTGLWIGCSDAATEGAWKWVNGEPFAFTLWATGRPNSDVGNTLDYAEVSGGASSGEVRKWYDRSASTIRDGYILEIGYATNPKIADTDGDGLNDGAEIAAGANPLVADTDGDGYYDGYEVSTGYSPIAASSTPEGLSFIRIIPASNPVSVEFSFSAANGVSYRIEDSTDLQHWLPLESNIIGHGAAVTRTYATGNTPRRFFRAARN